MKKLNITRSILSITSPGTNLVPPPSRQNGNPPSPPASNPSPSSSTSSLLCPPAPHSAPLNEAALQTRLVNTELSHVCQAHPTSFSFFASLPLPDIPASLAEIDYVLDGPLAGVIGFAVLSNNNGVYLGDPSLDPIFEKLNSRKAVLFIHPTTCQLLDSSQNGVAVPVPVKPDLGYPHPRPMMEFMFDETRAIANLLLSGTVEKYPAITYIMSHCGCALPSIIDRIAGFASLLGKAPVAGNGNGNGEAGLSESQGVRFKRLLRERFYFDLAGFPFPTQIHGLLRMLGEGGEKRLVYGTDYPFTPGRLVVQLAGELDAGTEQLFDEGQREGVYVKNAERLLGFRDE